MITYRGFVYITNFAEGDPDSSWERFGLMKKKRKSRWATDTESDKTVLNGLPVVIPPGLTKEQEEQYLCK